MGTSMTLTDSIIFSTYTSIGGSVMPRIGKTRTGSASERAGGNVFSHHGASYMTSTSSWALAFFCPP